MQKVLSQNFTPLAKLHMQTTQVESRCRHLVKFLFRSEQDNELRSLKSQVFCSEITKIEVQRFFLTIIIYYSRKKKCFIIYFKHLRNMVSRTFDYH